MKKTKALPPKDEVASVIFRPVASDASKDFRIPGDVARRLFQEGIICGDATNGGYMPNPNPKSNYNVRQHRCK